MKIDTSKFPKEHIVALNLYLKKNKFSLHHPKLHRTNDDTMLIINKKEKTFFYISPIYKFSDRYFKPKFKINIESFL